METQIELITDLSSARTKRAIAEAGRIIREGGLVGFPTETVYGLGADSFNPTAVAAIFAAKGRPADNPLISHISSLEMLDQLTEVTPLALKLAEKFWPGPLTLVLPKKASVPDIVTAGLDTVAVRYPVHPGALALIESARTPIAAPSANISGRPSPTEAAHVFTDLKGKIPLILDGGTVDIGLESTVVNACNEIPVILRPGFVTAEMIIDTTGEVAYPTAGDSKRPSAPGMKYRHYAPRGMVHLANDSEQALEMMGKISATSNETPFLILCDKSAHHVREAYPNAQIFIIAKEGDLDTYARNIFTALRLADDRHAQEIILETVKEKGLGAAIMNRVRKAAAQEPPVNR